MKIDKRVEISDKTVFNILSEELDMKKSFTRLVSRLLATDQKYIW